MRWCAALLVAATVLSTRAGAQTVIVADGAGSSFDTHTTVTPSGATTTISGGTQTGGNLFHSFSAFSLGTGETALWTASNPASVTAVINRVTGGSVSTIKGTLSTSGLPNANFFFINPAGIVLGDGFRLDVAGAVHFSTAQELRFADGARYSATTPGGSTFTVAAPASFGFLGGQGNIAVSDPSRTVMFDGTLGLSAANVAVSDSTVIVGGLRTAAVGMGAMEIDLEAPLPGGLAGRVDATNSILRTVADTGTRTFDIAADIISLEGSKVQTDAGPASAGADIALTARQIDVLGGSQVLAITNTASRTGDIHIAATDGVTLDGGEIRTRSNPGATGDVGAVMLDTGTLSLANGAFITATTFSSGQAGVIAIDADTVTLATGSTIASATTDQGDAGLVQIHAGTVALAGISTINGSTQGAGHAGAVMIDAGLVDVSDGSSIKSEAHASGDSGNIAITADRLVMTGASSRVSVTSFDTGRSGDIAIDVGSLEMSDGAFIASQSLGSGEGGGVRIGAQSILMDTGSAISSDTYGDGNAGGVGILASTLKLTGGAFITSQAFGNGDGGLINITADAVSLSQFAAIGGDTEGNGHGGMISVNADSLSLDTGGFIATRTFGPGNGGGVSVKANKVLLDSGTITADAEVGSTGTAGNLGIEAGTLTLTNASFLGSDSEGTGDAGRVGAAATQSIMISGGSSIASDTYGVGNGGNVHLDAPQITLADQGFVTSNSFGAGVGGTVEVLADSLTVTGDSRLTATGFDAGAGGDIFIDANKLAVSDGGAIAARALATGPGGLVKIEASEVTMSSGGAISSSTLGAGNAGKVDITAGDLDIGTQAEISSLASGTGNAGSIAIAATNLRIDGGGILGGTDPGAGNAGDIKITTDLLSVKDGTINTSLGSQALPGSIGITASEVVLDHGTISADLGDFALPSTSLLGIAAKTITLLSGSAITAVSRSAFGLGSIDLRADLIDLLGPDTQISTSNAYAPIGLLAVGPTAAIQDGAGAAGSIRIKASRVAIREGAVISSNSVAGPAGDIDFAMPAGTGLLVLEGVSAPGVITTSSGPGTGGVITIENPLAVITNGGTILAQGQQGGAFVVIASRYFIRSADRLNVIKVDGSIAIDANLFDVSAGLSNPGLAFLDSSKVLSGQCAAARVSGEASQISARSYGPYVAARVAGTKDFAVVAVKRSGC